MMKNLALSIWYCKRGQKTQGVESVRKIPGWPQKTLHKKYTAKWTPVSVRSMDGGGCTLQAMVGSVSCCY